MIRDLMLAITGTPGDGHALESVVALGTAMGARLTVLETVYLPLPMSSPWGLSPDIALGDLHDRLREEGELRAQALRERLGRTAVAHTVEVVPAASQPPAAVTRHAHLADIAVLTAPNRAASDHRALLHAYFASLLFGAGRPVLAIPATERVTLPPERVVVAWRSTREATRALHDAMPLLRSARAVEVVIVEESGVTATACGGEAVVAHLVRHGVPATLVSLPRGPGTVATDLLRQCVASDAQLLVAGGYGHARVREWALGGTTRDLLDAMHLPVLFSH